VTLWQAAVLAGLPRAPSRLNPRADPEAAADRAREVLDAMAATGAISARQAARAAEQIAFPPPPPHAGWFADWTAEQAQGMLPPGVDALVRSTLDSRLQSLVEARVAAMLDGPGAAGGATQAAVVVLDAETGAVRAMVGGRDYQRGTYNRAVAARRQPGSAFKPFVWLAALEKGMRPDSEVLDVPIRLGNWSPANFEHVYRGEITLEEALALSSNVAAIRLLLRAGGARAVAAVAHRLGIADKLPDNASLALGTGEVGLLELAAAYAPFFNGGHLVTPTGLESILADRRRLPLSRPEPVQAIAPETAAAMAHMLDAVVARGTGREAAIPGRVVGGKTGTTQDERDAWFVGSVDRRIVGVWIGNDRGRPMHGITGGTLPARLFRDIGAVIR
jgi:penicillin-binding protein 1A